MRAMPAAVKIRTDFTAGELRRLAAATKNANQRRRLLSLAPVLDGMSRAEAARIGGMDRQPLRDWVHRFNERGPEGLKDTWSKGNPPRLSAEQQGELVRLVETGPDRAVHGVVRWRRVDLQRLLAERFGVTYHERTVGKLLKALGFSHISARPRHPAQDERIVAEFKKLPRRPERSPRRCEQRQAGGDWVPGRDAPWPEERDRAAMGQTRITANPAGRPALRERLPLWGDLPGARQRRGACPALCRHRGPAASPRRDLPRRMAHHGPPGRAEEPDPDLPPLARPGVEPGRDHLAVPTPDGALQPRLRD